MSPKSIYVAFNIFGVLWVGVWGFLMFRYPNFFANWNARFGLRMFASPKYVAFTRKWGIAGMALAAVSAVGFVVTLIFGLKWY